MRRWLPFCLSSVALLLTLGCPPAEHNPNDKKDSGGLVVDAGDVEGGVLDIAGQDQTSGADHVSTPDSSTAPDTASGSDAASAGDSATGVDQNTAADATASGDASALCVSDRECDTEQVCEGGHCIPGCRVRQDCPRDRPVCDTRASAIGVCVQCVLGTDCQAPLDRCESSVCTSSCSQQDPCIPPAQCDSSLGYCVRCVEDLHCPTGNVCIDHDCVEGCNTDANCGQGEICENHSCIPGCRTAPADTCPENFHCNTTSGFCEAGCGTASTQCPENETCIANACYAACSTTETCPDGQHCNGTSCVDGCWDASASVANCGFARVCDQADGLCVECFTGDASVCTTTGRVCDEVNRVCAVQCTNNASTWACENSGGHCDPSRDNLCVECLQSDQCAPGETCNTSTGRCVSPSNLGLCASCDDDAQCGGAGDLCVNIRHNFAVSEQVCGLDCAQGQACPRGTSCKPVGDPVVRGLQCLPDNSVTSVDTCAARLDLVEEKACQRNWECGLSIGDALCSGYGASMGLCSVSCDMALSGDCPEGFVCEDPPPENNRDPAPRCAPQN